MSNEAKIVFLRHGESMGNVWSGAYLDDRYNFLTIKGMKQAEMAGIELVRRGFHFGQVFTSGLTRALQTATTVMQTMDDWKRHYLIDERFNEWTNERDELPGWVPTQTRQQHFEIVREALEPVISTAMTATSPVLCVTHFFTMQDIFKALESRGLKVDGIWGQGSLIPNAVPFIFDIQSNEMETIHAYVGESAQY